MKHAFLLLVFIILLNANSSKNELILETSPYLQQHSSNPINWYPWSDRAFELAKKEKKAVFLSIGYSTCHWCHVMARESFENEDIARLFNKYFISIKVDREEMPHLDSYYQELHVKLKKRVGGWPLSAFLTHDKKPFYVATYIPPAKEHFHEGLDTLLPRIYKEYTTNYMSVLKQAEDIESIMKKPTQIIKNNKADISAKTLSESIKKSYDDIYSGFGRGKKFPEASKLELMMDLAIINRDKELEKKSLEMLDTMVLRGIYDHVEGGFFRYAVDAAWEIPHFEKMLYNQAELIPLYVRAYLLTDKKLYKDVVAETIDMLDKRFVKKSLYYSSSDADTNHKEGEYFIFSTENIEKALLKNRHVEELKEALEFTILGNFEGKVHLNFYTQDRPEGFNKFKIELAKFRKIKEYPFIDRKINTAWNAMMIQALYSASLIDEKYAKKADKHLEALKNFMFNRGELYHQSLIGLQPTQLALLEDYSFLISALIEGYEVDFSDDKLAFAEYLINKAMRKFYKNKIWYLSDDKLRIKAGMNDKYYTSAVANMAQNLIKLASLKASFKYEKIAISTLESLNSKIEKSQSNTPSSAIAFLMQSIDVVTLKNNKETLKRDALKIKDIKHPYVLTKKDKTDKYLACTMRSCFAIEDNFESLKSSVEKQLNYQ